jgi:hypothetical protein
MMEKFEVTGLLSGYMSKRLKVSKGHMLNTIPGKHHVGLILRGARWHSSTDPITSYASKILQTRLTV